MGRGPHRVRRIDAALLERAALDYATKYAATRRRLADVLRRRVDRWVRDGATRPADVDAMVDLIVERFATARVVDDEAVARARTAALRARGTSARGIAQKLRGKGVPDDVARAAVAVEDGPDAELAAARRYAQRRKLGPWRTDDDERRARRRKDLAAVARQGFAYDVARRAIDGDA